MPQIMNSGRCRLLSAMLALVVGAAAHAAPGVDVAKLAGKNMAMVTQQLKALPTCSKTRHGTKCDYSDGRVEIVYIGGKADWITINNLETVPFSDTAITALGFDAKPPSFRSPGVIRWKGLPGVAEVSIFKGQRGTDYAYIKVATP